MPSGSSAAAKRQAASRSQARLASMRSVARPAVARPMVPTRSRSASTFLPTFILKVVKPCPRRSSTSAAMALGATLLNGVSSGSRTSSGTASSGCPHSISSAVPRAVAATGLAPIASARCAWACATRSPTRARAQRLQNAQPPARVSLLEPGEIWPSPKPLRPLSSRTTTMMGSKSSKVRYDKR